MNKSWFSVCGLLITATGLVPFDHIWFYPFDYGGGKPVHRKWSGPLGGLRPVDQGTSCSSWA